MRTVLGILALTLVGTAFGQVTISDIQCRQDLTKAFESLKVIDTNNLSAYSYGLRLDTTETLANRTTNYVGWLKLYDDSNPTSELIRAEMTVFQGNTQIQRTVADGRKVWSYDPVQNAYSVNAYNTEIGPNTQNYRSNFVSQFKQTASGNALNLMTLMDQASITGAARVKDWLGGLTFQGNQTIDPNNPLIITEQIWQSVPDNSRFVQFNLQTLDAGATWSLQSIQVHKVDRVGSLTKVTDTFLTQAKDNNGIPYAYPANGADFVFIPPARSKVLASPRSIKF